MRFFNFCIYLLLFGSLFSCGARQNATITEMEFNVDSTLVNDEVKDSLLHISYKVPSEWTTVPTSDSSLSQLNAGGIRLSNLLKNAAGTVVFSVSDVREVADSIFQNMNENYKSSLNPSGAWSNVEKAEFRTKEFQVRQFVLSKQGQTLFKMLFGDKDRPSFQIDYSIVTDSAFATNTKTLESIIGSLHRYH
jgi:hypothetical protein